MTKEKDNDPIDHSSTLIRGRVYFDFEEGEITVVQKEAGDKTPFPSMIDTPNPETPKDGAPPETGEKKQN